MGLSIDKVSPRGIPPSCCFCRKQIKRGSLHTINKVVSGQNRGWKEEKHYHFSCSAEALEEKLTIQLLAIMNNSEEVSKKEKKKVEKVMKRRGVN